MSAHLEILRFKWKPYSSRVLLAAWAQPGPVSRAVWVARTGIPDNHLLDALRECERLGGVRLETRSEGLCVGHPREMELWGGQWRNRWRRNPEGLRKVLNMVREDQASGRQPRKGSTWGRFASDLWARFVEVKV